MAFVNFKTKRRRRIATSPPFGASHAETAMREGELRFRELLEALPTPIYTTDANGALTYFNQAAVEFWGRRPEIGASVWCGSWRLFNPDGSPLPHDQCPMAIALKEDRCVRNVEAIAERPDGTRVPFMPFPTPLHDCAGRLVGAVNMLVDIGFHKRAAVQQRQLINELNHRVKNTLSTAQSIVSQTLRSARDLGQARTAVDDRLLSLGRAYDVLTTRNWEGADLRQIAQVALACRTAEAPRCEIEGPDVELTPKVALALALAVHELAMNAVKHGALSTPGGKVQLNWRLEGAGGSRRLKLLWRESGGRAVVAPERVGFGTRLLEQGLAAELGGEGGISYPASGAVCSIDIGLPLHEAVVT
jgi:PAS domain S-box-containing protein